MIRFVISDCVLVHFSMNCCLRMLTVALSDAGCSDLDIFGVIRIRITLGNRFFSDICIFFGL